MKIGEGDFQRRSFGINVGGTNTVVFPTRIDLVRKESRIISSNSV